MKSLFYPAILLCISLLLIQCTKEDFEYSDAELDVFFESFEVEAALRGITIDLKSMGITGHIVRIQDDHVAGKCKHFDANPAMIMIDQEFWKDAHDLHKEYVVFHELGHCILNRRHLNQANDSGACQSIMASDNRVCGFNYSLDTRKGYLDELFLYSE